MLEVEHISYNIGTCALPDMYMYALGLLTYISGKALMPVFQLLHVCLYVCQVRNAAAILKIVETWLPKFFVEILPGVANIYISGVRYHNFTVIR